MKLRLRGTSSDMANKRSAASLLRVESCHHQDHDRAICNKKEKRKKNTNWKCRVAFNADTSADLESRKVSGLRVQVSTSGSTVVKN